MIIDDAYSGIKDKYFEQAQTKTGVVSGVVVILNDFVRKYDNARKTMNDAKQELKKTYVVNSAPFEQKNMEIFNTFNESVASIREDSRQKIADAIQQVKDKIAGIIASNLPEGAMDDVTIIRNFSGNLSDAEINVFLGKYKNSYLVTKTIFEAMSKGQKERLAFNFISADDVLGSLDSIESSAFNMIRTYNGAVPYDFAVMLDGSCIQTVNDAFETFVSAYER